MIKNTILICLTLFSVLLSAQNFSVTFGFPDVTNTSGMVDPSNTPTIAGITFTGFEARGTSTNPNASGRFSFTGWPVGSVDGDDNYGNFSAVLSPTIYYEVQLTVKAGYTLELNSLNFDVRRSGTGIRTYCVRSGLDNFTNNLAASTGTNSKLEVIPNDIFFWKYDSISTSNDQKGSRINFDQSFSAITNSLAIRFYAWNSEANGGSFSLDNVNFTGVLRDSLLLASVDPEFKNKNETALLNVYPNPCNTGLIKIQSESRYSSIQIINTNGTVVYSENYGQPLNERELELSELLPGVYILKVFCESGPECKTILIDMKTK